MVKYTCKICFKEFNKKDDYIKHTERRKKPCQPKERINIDLFANIPKNIPNIPNIPNVLKLLELSKNSNKFDTFEKNEILNEQQIYYNCNYCMKNFSTKFNLNKHIKNSCKVRKLDENKKEEIFNNLIEKEEKFNLLLQNFQVLQESNLNLQKSNIDLQENYKHSIENYKNIQENNNKLIESNKNLQKQIKELENKLKESNKTYDEKIKNVITKNINSNNTINNNTVNNIIIPSNKLVNFGKEDLSKIDYITILKTIFNPFIGGVKLYEELLKLIHFNPKFPEYQNIYMSDRNREKYMAYEDSDWKLSESSYNTIMEQINSLKELNEDKFDEILEQEKHIYKNAASKLYRDINKYFTEDENGKRNTEFMKIVDTKLKTTLYNNSDIPKNNFKKIKDEILANKTITNESLNLIKNDK